MSELKEVSIPDIRESIYASTNKSDAVVRYMVVLDKCHTLEAKMVRNKLKGDYLRYVSSKSLQKKTKTLVHRIHTKIVRSFPNITVTTKAREKALLSYFHKVLICLKEGKPLNNILDARACRIIIDKKDQTCSDEELIIELCKVVNTTLTYLIDKGYQPLPAPPAKDTSKFDPALHPDVYVPEKSYIAEEYVMYVKNYVNTPKENGYQSFHVLVKSPEGDVLEIQFRTYDMDFYAEHKLADHDIYKEKQIKKYDLPVLDRSKVHWSKYRYEAVEKTDENGEKYIEHLLSDDAGLEKALFICVFPE